MDTLSLQFAWAYLHTFACVGKFMSFTKAAEVLCISQSAVSHRIRGLEEQLGFPLFHRFTRKITFTREGEQLFEVYSRNMSCIEEEIRNIRGAKLHGSLVVTCAPSLAECWLLPRLPRFRDMYPELDIHILSSNALAEFENTEVDLAIHCSSHSQAGLHATPFLEENLMPVCSAEYCARHELADNPAALRSCALIHENTGQPGEPRYANWQAWAEWAGISGLALQKGYSFDRAELTATAAAQGLGVALGREWLIREAVDNGSLVLPFHLRFPAPQRYFVVTTQEGTSRAKVAAFRDWLLEEGRNSSPLGR